MPENPQEAFDRGTAAGRRDARLDGHDAEFEALHEDIRELTVAVNKMALAVQELALNAKSSAVTAVTLAEGLEKERTTTAAAVRREKDKDEKAWTPLQRFLAVLAGVSVLAGFGLAVAGLWIQARSGG